MPQIRLIVGLAAPPSLIARMGAIGFFPNEKLTRQSVVSLTDSPLLDPAYPGVLLFAGVFVLRGREEFTCFQCAVSAGKFREIVGAVDELLVRVNEIVGSQRFP